MARGDADFWLTKMVFRSPPDHPDARDVYLGGCGLITAFRGIYYLTTPPNAALFDLAGPVFNSVWAWFWLLGGLFVFGVACTGHKWEELDRYGAFALLMLWWLWGLLYLISATLDSGQRTADLVAGLLAMITGLVLTAGVITGIRKTQEIRLRQVAVGRIRELERIARDLTAENERLRLDLGRSDGDA